MTSILGERVEPFLVLGLVVTAGPVKVAVLAEATGQEETAVPAFGEPVVRGEKREGGEKGLVLGRPGGLVHDGHHRAVSHRQATFRA